MNTKTLNSIPAKYVIIISVKYLMRLLELKSFSILDFSHRDPKNEYSMKVMQNRYLSLKNWIIL